MPPDSTGCTGLLPYGASPSSKNHFYLVFTENKPHNNFTDLVQTLSLPIAPKKSYYSFSYNIRDFFFLSGAVSAVCSF